MRPRGRGLQPAFGGERACESEDRVSARVGRDCIEFDSGPGQSCKPVSVVVIGRNEAARLPECLASIAQMDYDKHMIDLIYVDSGSADASCAIARAVGARVFEEQGRPASAARARNRGLREAQAGIVYFVDGDMTVDSAFLGKAVPRLGENGVVCVIGRVEDRGVAWPSRILSTDWASKRPGLDNLPGGGGAFVTSALVDVDGYDANALVAEESELGWRLRQAGGSILMINGPMATHDYGVSGAGDLVIRYYRLGRHLARFLTLPRGSCECLKEGGRKLLWQSAAALGGLTLLAVSGYAWGVLLLPVLLAAYVPMRYRVQLAESGLGWHAFLYYYLLYAMKPVLLTGMLSYGVGRRAPEGGLRG
jgi:glycosyltransferase involved in cell wall biosynthesis